MSKLTKRQFENFVEFIQMNIDDDTENGDAVRLQYSGRYMYSKTCVGFVTGSPIKELVNLALSAHVDADSFVDEKEGDDFLKMVSSALRNAQTDNMGTKTIVYFPQISNDGLV